MAEAYERMGDVFQNVGEHVEARQQYEQAHPIRLALAKSDDRDEAQAISQSRSTILATSAICSAISRLPVSTIPRRCDCGRTGRQAGRRPSRSNRPGDVVHVSWAK